MVSLITNTANKNFPKTTRVGILFPKIIKNQRIWFELDWIELLL
jgi:hypothetical protein